MLTEQSHPRIFSHDPGRYSPEAFHTQGSRILSRSFTIPRSATTGKTEDAASDASTTTNDESEDLVVAMIPIADALNAATGMNNARLFNDDELNVTGEGGDARSAGYTMKAIELITAESQIVRLDQYPLLMPVQHLP